MVMVIVTVVVVMVVVVAMMTMIMMTMFESAGQDWMERGAARVGHASDPAGRGTAPRVGSQHTWYTSAEHAGR